MFEALQLCEYLEKAKRKGRICGQSDILLTDYETLMTPNKIRNLN